MKKSICLISTPMRLITVMPLIFGLVTIVAAPTARAVVTIDEVDILDGFVDVQENGAIGVNDDLNNVVLWCDEAMPVRVDIKDGKFDINEDGLTNSADDLFNCDLNDENTVAGVPGIPTRNQVDIRDGTVDVDEDGNLNEILNDDAPNVQLYVP